MMYIFRIYEATSVRQIMEITFFLHNNCETNQSLRKGDASKAMSDSPPNLEPMDLVLASGERMGELCRS